MTNYNLLPDSTRVWIYQSKTPLSKGVAQELQQHLSQFATNWISHNNQLRSHAAIYHNQFIVLMVDESQAGASGCSIDKSVHFLQQLEQHYGIDLFDRLTFTYKEGEEIKTAHKSTFAELYKAGKITDETLVFDNLVNTKTSFETDWLKPLKNSWHKRMI